MGRKLEFAECLASGDHLQSCDDDGYCDMCGFQEDAICPHCHEPMFSDEVCDCQTEKNHG